MAFTITLKRGNVAAASRPNTVATLTMFDDVSDLIDKVQANQMTLDDAKLAFLARASEALARAIDATNHTDADYDQRVATYTAEVAAQKALRPGGSL